MFVSRASVVLVFGFSFGEIVVLLILALVVVGPRQLPTMLRKAGQWITQARRMATDMRSQSGIDELLRDEGLAEDLRAFRQVMQMRRGNLLDSLAVDIDAEIAKGDKKREPDGTISAGEALVDPEYPVEGCDSYGAGAEDMEPYVKEPDAQAEQEQPPAAEG